MAQKFTSDQLAQEILNGWRAVSDAWAYASATTITVPAGALLKYSVGDRLKLTQTTEKFFYIVGVADTLLTITGGSSYTLTNAAISNISVSHEASPVGFPQWFNWTPTHSRTGGAYSNNPTTNLARFTINGRTLTYQEVHTQAGTPGSSGNQQFTLPVSMVSSFPFAGQGYNNMTGQFIFNIINASVAILYRYDATGECTGGHQYMNCGTYQI